MQITHITAGAALMFALASPALAQQSGMSSSQQPQMGQQSGQGAEDPASGTNAAGPGAAGTPAGTTATGKTADPRHAARSRGPRDNNNTQNHLDAEARGNGQAPTGADANPPPAQSPNR